MVLEEPNRNDGLTLISVVVPFRNAREDLPILAAALDSQRFPQRAFQVVWVDDGSNDRGVEWLRSHSQPNWTILESQTPFSSYAARNRGIRAATAAVLAFTDADCRPHSDWLTRGMAALERSSRVAGRVKVELSATPSAAEIVDATRFLRQEHYVTEGFAATANSFVRRKVFETVGYFDETLLSGGDNEFGWRCLQAGIPIQYAADAVVTHPVRRTVRALLKKGRRVGFGAGQIARRGRMPLGQMLKRARARVALAKGGSAKEQPSIQVATLHLALALASAIGMVGGLLRRPTS